MTPTFDSFCAWIILFSHSIIVSDVGAIIETKLAMFTLLLIINDNHVCVYEIIIITIVTLQYQRRDKEGMVV